MFCPSTSDLAGLPTETLQAWLTEAQTALHQLSIGARVATVSYAQGDGSRAVSYTQSDLATLRAHIAALKAQLGIGIRARRPVRFIYR